MQDQCNSGVGGGGGEVCMHANGNPCKAYPPQISDHLSSDRSTSRGWSVFGLQVHQLLKNVSCTSNGQDV